MNTENLDETLVVGMCLMLFTHYVGSKDGLFFMQMLIYLLTYLLCWVLLEELPIVQPL
jgi:hypothetical protein